MESKNNKTRGISIKIQAGSLLQYLNAVSICVEENKKQTKEAYRPQIEESKKSNMYSLQSISIQFEKGS